MRSQLKKTHFLTSLCTVLFLLCFAGASDADLYEGGIYKQVLIPEENNYSGQVEDSQYDEGYSGQAQQVSTNEKGIIGVSFLVKANIDPTVQQVFPGTPAFHAGLQTGDRIVMINNEAVKGWSKDEIDYAIPDHPGEAVTFLIDRYGKLTMRAVVVQAVHEISSSQVRNVYSEYP